jgi:hypothetical protein
LIVLFCLPILLIESLYFVLFIPFLFFGWGKLFISLPIKTGIEDSESGSWGINYHNDKLWIYIGGNGERKYLTINMFWMLDIYNKSYLDKNKNWVKYDFFHNKNITDMFEFTLFDDKETYKAYLIKFEYRMKFLYFTRFLNREENLIKISSCDYISYLNINKDESIYECIKRNGFDSKFWKREEKINQILY